VIEQELEPMDEATSQLRTALVTAYPKYVARVLMGMGVEVDDVIADAIVEGVSVLDGLLASFTGKTVERQRHSPLELFGEALRPIDRTLAMSGLAPRVRGTPMPPWDRYALCPGSSQVLGPEAHEAHLRWGVSKAATMAAGVRFPAACIVCLPQDRDILESGASEAGYRLVGIEAIDRARVVVVDTSVPRASNTIAAGVASGQYVIAFRAGIDDMEAVGLNALGADRVVDRTALLADVAAHLPAIA
jgi:hypothetical protein